MVFRQLFAVACAIALAGCPGGDEAPPKCITVDTACTPLYTPTFANVYNMTLRPSCGTQLSSCHAASNPQGGLSFGDEQAAYDGLMRGGRLVPGDAACSELIVRTSSPGTDYEMPPGAPLSAPTQCALIQWVQAGAQR